jgi:NADH-quinone oxidoreductase subunit C
MTTDAIIAQLQANHPGLIASVVLDAIDPHVVVAPEHLVALMHHLRDEPVLKFEMLNDITGVDYLETDAKKLAKAGFEPHLEILYHLSSITHNQRFTVKVQLPRWKDGVAGNLPEVPTLAHLWPTADWQEREVYDLLGVHFQHHPDPRRILLEDDWVGHPLRKDYEFPLEYHGIRCR